MSKINANDVKLDIINKRPKGDDRLALLSGFCRVSFSLVRRGGGDVKLCLDCSSAQVRAFIDSLMMELFKVTADVAHEDGFSSERTLVYGDGEKLLKAMRILKPGDGFELEGIDGSFSKSGRSYCCGVFLGCGSLSLPVADDAQTEKSGGYYIEFSFTTEALANDFLKLLASYNIYAHLTVRAEKYIVYIKYADDVSDCLALLGADRAVLGLNAAVAAFAVKCNVNRQLNCEMANMTRTVDAAVSVIDSITKIESTVGLDALDKKLKEAAIARKADPHAALSKIAAELDISKSGLKHRFDRINAFAAALDVSQEKNKDENGREM